MYGDAEDERRGRSGGRSKFTAADDLIIVREVTASDTHIAAFGEKRESFAQAAPRANFTVFLAVPVTANSIQDRYTMLQTLFDRADRKESLMSGTDG